MLSSTTHNNMIKKHRHTPKTAGEVNLSGGLTQWRNTTHVSELDKEDQLITYHKSSHQAVKSTSMNSSIFLKKLPMSMLILFIVCLYLLGSISPKENPYQNKYPTGSGRCTH